MAGKNTLGSRERVQSVLEGAGIADQIRHLDTSTRTAADAAAAVGCDVGQIVKSLVFRGAQSALPVLALTSGRDLVDTERLALLVGEPIERPNANFVRETTGFAIGGVAPVGHVSAVQIWIENGIGRYCTVWAAAGTPNSVFMTNPDQLGELTKGQWGQFAKSGQ